MKVDKRRKALRAALAAAILAGLAALAAPHATAEYGDVVMNNYSTAGGMRPVVFPHWFHRVRFSCKVCHGDLGFKFEAGGNQVNMVKIIDGQYCGACHDGGIAWSVENCALCHTGVPGMATHVHESTTQKLGPAPTKGVATAAKANAREPRK